MTDSPDVAPEITERLPGSTPGVAAAPTHNRGAAARQSNAPKPRRKPALPEALRPEVDEARERHRKRPTNPGVTVERSPSGGYQLASPHRDLEAWEVQICDAFGTRSYSTFSVFLDQLSQLCSLERDEDGNLAPSELELNAALNIVAGIRPRNPIEAALAAQMVAVHFLTMKVASDALRHGWTDARTASIAAKLGRTFAQQCDALSRLRGRTGKQTIKVQYERHDHRHVHVREGDQENGSQAQASMLSIDGVSALQHAPGASLRCPDTARD